MSATMAAPLGKTASSEGRLRAVGPTAMALLPLGEARAASVEAAEETEVLCVPCKGEGEREARVRGGEGGGVRLEGATRGCSLGAVAAWLVVSVCEASSGPADEDEGEGEAEAARAVVLLL